MDKKARLGFIGLGIMGGDLLKEARKHPAAYVTGLCDVNTAALNRTAEAVGTDTQLFTNYREMLDRGDLDGVVVAVPQYMHAEISIAALEAGCTTFCEKPMAMSVKECETMISASASSGKGLMIGQVLRYIGPYRYILELVRSGELGKPVAMRTIRSMGYWKEPWLQPWRLKGALSGGLLPEVNVHEIDLMLCIMGTAESVTAVSGHLANEQVDYEDFITGTVRFSGGGLGSITSVNCDFLGRNSGEIYLENGSIYYESLTGRVYVAKKNEDACEIAYADIHPEWENGVYREMREFIEACLGEHEVTISGEDGMRALEIAEAMYLSAREGRRVALPLPRQ